MKNVQSYSHDLRSSFLFSIRVGPIDSAAHEANIKNKSIPKKIQDRKSDRVAGLANKTVL